jgi:predicted nucleic acid-binding protein
MAWLLDTNVLSETRKPRPDLHVVAFLASKPIREFFTCSVVVAEIRFGLATAKDSIRKAALKAWLTYELRPRFRGRTLDVTEDVMLRWRILLEGSRKSGQNYSQPDLLIAATAIEHNLTLVTRNTKDFTGLPLSLLNPWEPQS